MTQLTYTVGGNVDSTTSLYVERSADEELLRLCREGQFAFMLTSRQMGKSSMMDYTARRLEAEGVRTVRISLERIGTQGVTPEQWYLGLAVEIQDQLGLATDALDYWEEQAHLSLTQRLSNYLERIVLAETEGRIVIFIDEIDTTLSLDFSCDDFFAAIRMLYNLRGQRPQLRRLGFVLIGVATPNDLIADEKRTPFNIGQRVELGDFSRQEATTLEAGLGADAGRLMDRILHWTDGHPFLTLRLCDSLADHQPDHTADTEPRERVDTAVADLFFDQQAGQDLNLEFVKDMLTRRLPGGVPPEEILLTYQRVLQDRAPEPDEARSPIKNHLKLSGVVKRDGPNLRVRNRIYHKTFDDPWIKQRLPVKALWQQIWRRLTTTLAPVAVVASLLFLVLAMATGWLAWDATTAKKEADQQRALAEAAEQEAKQAQREAVEARGRPHRLYEYQRPAGGLFPEPLCRRCASCCASGAPSGNHGRRDRAPERT
ncbi:AAA-like domain-containing protein [Candidatus Thiosymbion oneisti]|uniref:AAA-like domain-containing protein n=1 Tax=Candidatus Thiosymbion oneisti TaxID=589554 RepID=UPI000AA5DC80|nr:AAA-like domain-containing protein [Candidatus Thiosymbion oneisti]